MFEIIEEPEYVKKVKKLFPNYKRFDEIVNGIIWTLGRYADRYVILENDEEYGAIKSENNEITIYFEIKEYKVFLLDIDRAKEE